MIVKPEDFDFEWFDKIPTQKRKAGNPKTRSKRVYRDIITAFDIETTTLNEIEQAVMYIWQWQFGSKYTVIGRTWDSFLWFVNRLSYFLRDRERIVVFVHNLSFEFQFLRGVYDFKQDEVFAVDSRKVLKCEMLKTLEFRCSYIHSNMSLAEYLNKMGVEHEKKSGFDYTKKRYPWTKLSQSELEYCINDVKGLVEAIQIEMKADDDNIYSFPLTSTGYVRRDVKQAMRVFPHDYVRNQQPDQRLYEVLREAFRGGDTHANRFYVGFTVKNVKSMDRSSSYPDVICNCEFPISEFTYAGQVTVDGLLDLIKRRRKAIVFRVAFENIKLSNPYWGCPYLAKHKCRNTINGVFDNGRIISADYLETTITDIDFEILLDEYEFSNIMPYDVYHARKGKLPQPIIDECIHYYKLKTELKGIKEQEIYYMKSKNKLNSIYGMMAQDPVKQDILFTENEEGLKAFIEQNKDVEAILEEQKRKRFLAYQWGVWTTAHARKRLHEGIKLAGEGFVYADTDSVKYVGNVDWDDYNGQRMSDSIDSGAYAQDRKGNVYYMGVYDLDGEYTEFRTLGAKKYCYVENGKLKVTIAGVNKKKGAEELSARGGIDAFETGFVFTYAGGTESVYNDYPEIKEIEIEGHKLPITSNLVIRDSTYTLGITAEYSELLKDCQTIFLENY